MTHLVFLLRRYLFPEKENLMGLAVWLSVAGVALGIVQLMVVLSVMSGFQEVFQTNYTRISSHIVVVPRYEKSSGSEIKETLKGIPGISGVTPVAIGQGMVLKNGVGGVVLEGIDLTNSNQVTPWDSVWVEPPAQEIQSRERHWMWLGQQLATKLRVKAGDSVNVMIADGESKRIIPFTVSAITKFGIYDHDLRFARIDLGVLQEIFGKRDLEPMYKCRVEDPDQIPDLVERVKEVLGHSVVVKPWNEVHQNIFLAVEHQKRLLFLVLEIVIALAAMNLVNLLMMSSYHRRRDVAILRAMGMRLKEVFLFFVAQGALVGFFGIIIGITSGYGVCRLIEHFQPSILAESVYNVTRLPIRVVPSDVALICVVALFLCIIFSVAPAWKAALSRPVEALRYE